MLSMTLWLLLVLVPLQIFLGDQHGLNTLEYQPAKLAAIEGDFKTETPTPLNLLAIPDQNAGTDRFDISIPRLGSIILTHTWSGTVKGLDQFPRRDWPTVIFPFMAFRLMVGVGLLMLALVIWGNWMRRGGRLFRNARFLRVLEFAAPLGFIAVIAGWVTTETGRQPWTVYGLLRTADSVSPSLTGGEVLISLVCYTITYIFIFGAGLMVMSRIIHRGPELTDTAPNKVEGGRPREPLAGHPVLRATSEPQ